MDSVLIILDTNIIIEIYKSNDHIIKIIDRINKDDLAISIITFAELIYGARNKAEQQKIIKSLNSIQILDITPIISKTFRRLMENFSLSHSLSIPDALIAATSINNNAELFTLNIKDFKYIENIKLFEYNS